MKVFAISDLHLSVNNPKPMDIFGPVWEGYLEKIFLQWKEKVKEEDVVLLPGDFSWAMKLEETKEDFNLLSSLPGRKILIRGNHDYWWKSISAVRNILPENFYAIQNDAIKFGKYVFCGTRGWQVPETNVVQSEEDKRIFNREVLRLKMTLEEGKKLLEEGDKLICMMHYPPVNFTKQDSEFSLLLEQFKVDSVVFGHLHGYKNIETKFEKNKIKYILTSCDILNNEIVLIDG